MVEGRTDFHFGGGWWVVGCGVDGGGGIMEVGV